MKNKLRYIAMVFKPVAKYKFLYLVLISMMPLFSCEKAITFDLDEPEPKLVVEATIENGERPMVILSKSLNFFSTIDLSVLSNSFVHNAEIFVSNGILTHRLKEYNIPVGGGFSLYYYSVDSSNLPTAFVGELNRQYSLRIVSEGKEYAASTTIPNITKRIDSLFWRQAPAGNPPEKVVLMVKAADPPGLGDYVRYYTRQNSQPFYPGLASVFDDQVIDGTSYEVQVERGVDRNSNIPEDYNFFNKGDTVTLKLCNIDKATFDFWRTMEFTFANIGNPFASPTKVISNISNGGLGYFGGYACQYRTIIIPR
jgi:hypothetical protein